MTRAPAGWLQVMRTATAEPEARLVFFPPAGASASSATVFGDALPASWSVLSAQYPARGPRRREPQPRSIREITDLCLAVVAEFSARTILFGHSFGAVVAYDVAQMLQRAGRPAAGLLVSGAAAPGRWPAAVTVAADDRQLLAQLASQGGTQPALLDNEELMSLMLPVVRADVALAYEYRDEHPGRLTTPVLGLGGRSDPSVPAEALATWRHVTDSWLGHELVDGGHFFYHEDPASVAVALDRHWSRLGAPE